MKIAYLLESVGRTGGSVVLYKHMAALQDAGHSVVVVTPYGSRDWTNFANESSSSSSYGYFGHWGFLKTMQVGMRRKFPAAESLLSSIVRGTPERRERLITRRLLQNCPEADIVVATHSFTAPAAAQLNHRARCFYHMQGFEPWFSDDPRFSAVSTRTYHLPLTRIANCSWLASHLLTIGSHAHAIVHPGVDHSIFNAVGRTARDVSDSGTIRIVSYCDPRPLKGWQDSVAAMATVIEDSSATRRVEWHVFGHGSSSNCPVPVTHHGFLTHEQLASLYRSADILFVPSWLESFPLQPLEAMACGAAVVTTKTGTEDFAIHNETALVVPPKAPDVLAREILRLVKDSKLRVRLASSGQLMASSFTWERSISQLFATVLGGMEGTDSRLSAPQHNGAYGPGCTPTVTKQFFTSRGCTHLQDRL